MDVMNPFSYKRFAFRKQNTLFCCDLTHGRYPTQVVNFVRWIALIPENRPRFKSIARNKFFSHWQNATKYTSPFIQLTIIEFQSKGKGNKINVSLISCQKVNDFMPMISCQKVMA